MRVVPELRPLRERRAGGGRVRGHGGGIDPEVALARGRGEREGSVVRGPERRAAQAGRAHRPAAVVVAGGRGRRNAESSGDRVGDGAALDAFRETVAADVAGDRAGEELEVVHDDRRVRLVAAGGRVPEREVILTAELLRRNHDVQDALESTARAEHGEVHAAVERGDA